ncbi:MAG: hypothetical protein GY725_06085 [bacterium]|nr:hypothetical protein [bacterium]
MKARKTSLIVPLILCCGVIGTLAGEPAGGPSKPTAAVDFSKGGFSQALPFDTPFSITGAAADDLKSVVAYYCDVSELSEAELASHPIKFDEDIDNDKEIDPVACPRKKDTKFEYVKAHETTRWSAGPLAGKKNFVLSVGQSFDANRDFWFQFRAVQAPSDAALGKLRTRVSQQLDQALREREEVLEIAAMTPAVYSALQNAIRSSIDKLSTPTRPVVYRGTGLFAPSPSDDTVWNTRFVALLETHPQRRVRQQHSKNSQKRAAHSVKTLVENLDLATLAGELFAAQTSQDDATKLAATKLLGSKNEALLQTMVSLSDPFAVADGDKRIVPDAQAVDPAIAIPDLWKPVDLDARLANLRINVAVMDEFAQFLRQVELAPLPKASLTIASNQQLTLRRQALEATERLSETFHAMRQLRGVLERRETIIGETAQLVSTETRSYVGIQGSTQGNLYTRARSHISVDLGFVYAHEIEEILPYVGTNFYCRPVNRQVPLKEKGGFLRRFSFQVGITVNSLEEKNSSDKVVRDDLFGSSSVVLGAGLRINDYTRLSIGTLWFKERTDPFDTSLDITADAFFAVSFDWNIKGLLGKIGSTFGN